MTISRRTFLSTSLVVVAGTWVGCQSTMLHKALDVRLALEARGILADYGFPGITVAVASPDGIMTRAAGFANQETGEPMSPETTMLAASIGKTFVAATLLQLADEGRIGLDDPINVV